VFWKVLQEGQSVVTCVCDSKEAEMGESCLQASLEKSQWNPFSKNKLGVVVHTYNPS
jgi:hypothetical protein